MASKAPALAAALLFASFAGCTTMGPSESTGAAPPPPRGNVTATGFAIVGPSLLPADGIARPLREDDEAHVKFTVRNDGAEAVSHFVTYIENGEVGEAQTVRLEPGEERDVGKVIPRLWGLDKIVVEVRAGTQHAKNESSVTAWPRTGESFDLGPATVRVDRWLQDAYAEDTVVNISVQRRPLPEGEYRQMRNHILCASQAGLITAHGESRPTLPEPGNETFTDVRLPTCPGTTYGVDFTGFGPGGDPFYLRVVFVEHGWTPPQT